MTNSSAPSASATAAVPELAGKYLTVLIGHESYGIKVTKVREIIRLQKITPVPQIPSYVKGVINLRGRIIPVIDLRLKFNLTEVVDTERTCIVVAQVALSSSQGAVQMGLIVDGVEEVANLTAADIAETPEFGAKVDTAYILGMANVKGVVKTLLEIDRVVAGDQLARFAT
jgi:purine-binding chemotaxis protein CheW